MGKIMDFMLKEHGELLALLMKYKKSKDKKDFEALKDKQGRHMLGEEKAIFVLYKGKRGFEVLAEILKQHEDLVKLEKAIENGQDSFKDLVELMKKHIKLEDSEFYPRLDKELDERDKEKILAKTKDYILGNIAIS